jgi:citrate lyase subunit beta/citryl-CoA lyase
MPGSNPRALAKARSLAADGLILDLEDAVAPDAKLLARAQVLSALTEGGYGDREILVRVNALSSAWGQDDVRAASQTGAHGILLPKVEAAVDVRQLAALMAEAGAPAEMTIWCMIETPLGILNVAEIAASSPRLAGFVMGTSDLAKDLHAAHTPMRLPLLVSLGQSLLAARAYGLAILDGVHLDLDDEQGFAESCRQGRDMGFDGKTLIHPKTIDAANQIYAPGADELAWSRRIIEAHAEATAAGQGVVVVDGKLIENLHVVAAQRLVALADQISVRPGAAS